MAKQHTTDAAYTNPDVRFERGDVDLRRVVAIGGALVAIIAVLSAATTWLGLVLTRGEERRKKSPLPEAAVDRSSLPPSPRLEGLEPIPIPKEARSGKKTERTEARPGYELFPPRAQISLRTQEEMLAKGDPKLGVLSIEDAIRQIETDHLLPARKSEPPANFAVPLPSKASSGRAQTGGK
jgi:hypothetical protein